MVVPAAGRRAPEVGDGERLRLVFEGLDTYATVYVDGEEVGSHANMFRPAAFEIGPGEHLVAIRFDPPLAHIGPPMPEQWANTPGGAGVDAQGPVRLRLGLGAAAAHDRHLAPHVGAPRAARGHHGCGVLDAGARSRTRWSRCASRRRRSPRAGDLAADVELRAPDGTLTTGGVTLRDGAGTAYLALDDPPLWWTHDLGEPALHDLRVVLRDGDEPVDTDERRVGVRTIELDQSPDPGEPGTRFFRFVLNGQPIYARGANWIPAESFPGAVEPARYARLLDAAREANMNMLRVWGGGIYESDRFYAGCDERGLLVWQDFMFACATYPEAELAEEVDLEARAQVARLRSHPCLALWCGCNENQWIHDRNHPRGYGTRVPGALFYDEILPRAVAEVDGRTPYWPGSPFGGNDHSDRAQGNVHNWEVWHGQSRRRFGEPSDHEITPETVRFDRYAEDDGRFVSEFGVLAAPDRETLRRWIPAGELFHHSEAMDHHTKDTPKNKVDMLLESVTGVAGDLDEFVDFSMIAQAEALKFGIEHFRRRKPHCSGSLVWQLNDCWPVLSWALLDYHGFGKAAYYAVRRAFAPVLGLAEGRRRRAGAVDRQRHRRARARHRPAARRHVRGGGGLRREGDVRGRTAREPARAPLRRSTAGRTATRPCAGARSPATATSSRRSRTCGASPAPRAPHRGRGGAPACGRPTRTSCTSRVRTRTPGSRTTTWSSRRARSAP